MIKRRRGHRELRSADRPSSSRLTLHNCQVAAQAQPRLALEGNRDRQSSSRLTLHNCETQDHPRRSARSQPHQGEVAAQTQPMLGLTELSNYLTLKGSFSAVSKPNFASTHAFESSRRDLHKALFCTALQSQFFVKN